MNLLLRTLAATAFGAFAFSLSAAPPDISVPSVASARVATTRLRVVPEHAGWTYRLGEQVKFKITAEWDGEPLEGLAVRFRVGPEKQPAEEKTTVLPREGLLIEGGTLQVPGFVRCSARVIVEGKEFSAVGTAGFQPEEIRPTQQEPADFDAFWREGIAALAKIPMDAQVTLLPEESNGAINVYHVSLATLSTSGGADARVYGILCQPKKTGRYPVVLRPPGAGVHRLTGDRDLAEKGFITFQIGVNGLPVNLPAEVYASLGAGALGAYYTFDLDDRYHYYYRRVYLSCIRADDFLVSLPNWDGLNLFSVGGSQGGQLAIMTAGLDPRVAAVVAFYPAYCDVTGYLHHRAGGWPHLFRPESSIKPSPEKVLTTAYYDTVNFARRIKVPGFYSWGYNDEVCPPTSMFAAYNVISAPKSLTLALEMGHAQGQEQGDLATNWLHTQMKR